MATKKDPTDPIRQKASRYPGVDVGAACTQSSFKVGKKSFLFLGEQGGRYKVMLKLDNSMPQAKKLAKAHPDEFAVGGTGWVTARFSAEKPLAKAIWEKWIEESYQLCLSKKSVAKKAAKGTRKKAAKKKVTTKKAAKKSTARKSAKKKASKKKATRKVSSKKSATKKSSKRKSTN